MPKFEIKESFTHKLAKELLHKWLVEPCSFEEKIVFIDQYGKNLFFQREDNHFIYMEYPVTKCFPQLIDEAGCKRDFIICDNGGIIISCKRYRNFGGKLKYCPCFKCPSLERPVKYVVDIVTAYKGNVTGIIEVVHKNPLSDKKERFLTRKAMGRVVEIQAKHILGQIKKPKELHVTRIC